MLRALRRVKLAVRRRRLDMSFVSPRSHGLRAMDAWHLAVAKITIPSLVEVGEERAFASRDRDQRIVAEELGLRTL